jgi:hypothetical protein
MKEDELEDLKRRVELRRAAAAAKDLKDELMGRNIPIEDGVLYLSANDVAEMVGCTPTSIAAAIRKGILPGRMTFRKVGGNSYAIHPRDAEEYARRHAKIAFVDE